MSKVTTGEELKTRFLADFIDDLCDLKIITRDGPLSIPYNFLESICGGNTIGGTRERKEENEIVENRRGYSGSIWSKP